MRLRKLCEKGTHIRIFAYPLAVAKSIPYHADIVADTYAKYPLAEEATPLGNTSLRHIKAEQSLPRGIHRALAEVYALTINDIIAYFRCHCQGVNANHYIGGISY